MQAVVAAVVVLVLVVAALQVRLELAAKEVQRLPSGPGVDFAPHHPQAQLV
jgi:hypothetical protein